jgi:prophage maintenance system killer protein
LPDAALEDHNDLFAWVIARIFLDMNDHPLKAPPDDALTLAAHSREDRITVPQIASQLRRWV